MTTSRIVFGPPPAPLVSELWTIPSARSLSESGTLVRTCAAWRAAWGGTAGEIADHAGCGVHIFHLKKSLKMVSYCFFQWKTFKDESWTRHGQNRLTIAIKQNRTIQISTRFQFNMMILGLRISFKHGLMSNIEIFWNCFK